MHCVIIDVESIIFACKLLNVTFPLMVIWGGYNDDEAVNGLISSVNIVGVSMKFMTLTLSDTFKVLTLNLDVLISSALMIPDTVKLQSEILMFGPIDIGFDDKDWMDCVRMVGAAELCVVNVVPSELTINADG